jgi:K+-sensing histidine kinase KdpD
MSIGAAISMTSPDAGRIIAAASLRAQERGERCFAIIVLQSLSGERTSGEKEIVAENLALIMARNASPVVQESDDIPGALISAARQFGVRTLFIGSARPRILGRSVAEKLVRLAPPFDIVIVRRDGMGAEDRR